MGTAPDGRRSDTALSKRLSYVLRHRPDSVGLQLDSGGWVDLQDLLHALDIGLRDLERVVAENGKQRFVLTDGRIRAQQGHSVPVDLGLVPRTPPDVLWHGTATRFVPAIQRAGLLPQGRHAVHLSTDPATARRVGARRGPCTVLRVDAGGLHRDGGRFCVSGNGVWLVPAVPPAYLEVVERQEAAPQPTE
jgi:putative RNA 2'-phosphotransferase